MKTLIQKYVSTSVLICIIASTVLLNLYSLKSRYKFLVVRLLSCVWLFVTPWTPDFPVLHYLPEFAQTHVHWVSDAIQPSYPLSPPSPPALNLSQHQGVFHWVSSLHQLVGHYIQLIYNFKTKANSLDLNKNTSLVSVGADSWESLGLQGDPTSPS